MVALNFQKQFADDVENLIKRQTMRAKRKDGRDPRPGQMLQLYTGMRTKSCRKLLPDQECKSVTPISVFPDRVWIEGQGHPDIDEFAKQDGFRNFEDMQDWVLATHDFPFHGLLIKW